MSPFRPLFRNAHLQTVAGAFWQRPFDEEAFPVTATYYQTEPEVRVLVHSQQPSSSPRGTLLLAHGLEGSSEAGYMRSAAHAALTSGFAVHRLNTRGCGGTEALSNTLYHAGLTSDIRFVLEHLRGRTGQPVFLGGFSLGANMVIKLAGELGSAGGDLLAGVIAISTPLDLGACAAALNHPRCWLYQRRFLRNMAARLRRRHALKPGLFPLDGLDGVRSVYEFDDRITAPFFGFGGAEGYYGTQSAGLFLDTIAVPTLLIHSKDDPMIPHDVYRHPAFARNPHLRLLMAEHGGHVGFLARGARRFWVDEILRQWLAGNNSGAGIVW
ncbi:MAG: alpha/beta fold hydrolase [Bryobacterales bacterium]|nr:alpha/beta fold hydrolase [Bryobacterales bacterium]